MLVKAFGTVHLIVTLNSPIRRAASTGVLRAFNELFAAHRPDVPRYAYLALRDTLLRAFETPEWERDCPKVPIKTPPAFVLRLKQLAKEVLADIQSLENVRIFGKLDSLLEMPDISAI